MVCLQIPKCFSARYSRRFQGGAVLLGFETPSSLIFPGFSKTSKKALVYSPNISPQPLASLFLFVCAKIFIAERFRAIGTYYVHEFIHLIGVAK